MSPRSSMFAAAMLALAAGTAQAQADKVKEAVEIAIDAYVYGGQTYYLSGNTWFQPAFGANGVHYTVVSAP